MGLIIGRKAEQRDLDEWCHSAKPELICVYGRRRVGKTYLVQNAFEGQFAFFATGSDDRRNAVQLKAFHAALRRAGCAERTVPQDWFEAFNRLRLALEQPDVVRASCGRRVVFLDEFPWLAAKRSDFLAAFSDFWNGWASCQSDLVVIICGSATSWIVKNILENTASMYNRVTRQLYVAPFDLHDVEEMTQSLRLGWSRDAVLQCYLVFGGLPYYLDMLDRRKSLSQNIDALCLGTNAPLRREVPLLMEASLGNAPLHRAILRELAQSKVGIRRMDLANRVEGGTTGSFKRALDDLEKCGYIRCYTNRYERRKPSVYQLVDPFLLFGFRFMVDRAPDGHGLVSWKDFERTPAYYAWRGNAFEIACVNHTRQIKHAIGISAVKTEDFPWSSSTSEPGAQIDMVIERADGVTNLCEMKYTDGPFVADREFEEDMARRRRVFQIESATKNTVQSVLVCPQGLRPNTHSWDIAHVVDIDDLFAF